MEIISIRELVRKTIDSPILNATSEERAALKEIFDAEGFGGREDRDDLQALDIVAERLDWLRDQRKDGFR